MDLPYRLGSDVAVLDGEGIGGYGVRVVGGDCPPSADLRHRLARVVGIVQETSSQSGAVPLKNRRNSYSKLLATFRKGDGHHLASRHDLNLTTRARRMQSPRGPERRHAGRQRFAAQYSACTYPCQRFPYPLTRAQT
jgi:hypothetical protein